MKKHLNYFVYGSWWVSICAAAMALLTCFELTGNWLNGPLLLFVSSSTLIIYNLNMLSGLKELQKLGTDSERHIWCIANARSLTINTGIGVAFSLAALMLIDLRSIVALLPFGLLAILYVIPILPIRGEARKLREFGLSKIFLIATVWMGLTCLVPIMESGRSVFETDNLLLMTERWIFILAITIPFDIRDLENDRKKNVCTIPSTIGWKPALYLSIALLILFLTLVLARLGTVNPIFLGYSLSTLLTIILISQVKPDRPEMFTAFWLEGTMLLQFAFIAAFSAMTC